MVKFKSCIKKNDYLCTNSVRNRNKLLLQPIIHLYNCGNSSINQCFQDAILAQGWMAMLIFQHNLPRFPHQELLLSIWDTILWSIFTLSDLHSSVYQVIILNRKKSYKMYHFLETLFLIKLNCWKCPAKIYGKGLNVGRKKKKWINEALLFNTSCFSFEDMIIIKLSIRYLLLMTVSYCNNRMTEKQFGRTCFSVLQRSKTWSLSLLDRNTYFLMYWFTSYLCFCE